MKRRSQSGIEPKNHFAWPGVAQSLPHHLFDKRRVIAQPFQDSLLLRQPSLCGGQPRLARRLDLLQFEIFAPGFDKKPARPDPTTREENKIKHSDDSARVHSSAPINGGSPRE